MTAARGVTILGAFSGRNKGDLAILRAELASIIQQTSIPLTLHLFSKFPKVLKGYIRDLIPESGIVDIIVHGAPTGYIGKDTLSVLLGSDKIIIGGGGLFFDSKLYNIGVSHILNLFLLSPVLKLAHKDIFIYCVGCSNFNSKLSYLMIRPLVTCARSIYARDTFTVEKLTKLSEKDVFLAADPSFFLKPVQTDRVRHIVANWPEKPAILLCLSNSLFSSKEISQPQKSIQQFCSVLEKFTRANDCIVLAYSNHTDQSFAHKLVAFCPDRFYPAMMTENHLLPEEIIALFSNVNLVVASPMHACIFAYLAGVPFLSIPYAEKVEQLNLMVKNENVLKVQSLDNTQVVLNRLEKAIASKPLPVDPRLVLLAKRATDELVRFICAD